MSRSFSPKYFSTSASRQNTPRTARFAFANYVKEPNYKAISEQGKRIRIPDEISGRSATPVTGATGFGRSRLPGIDPSVMQDSARLLQQAGSLGTPETGSVFANKIKNVFSNVFSNTVDSTGAISVDEAARKEDSGGLWGRIFG